MHLKSETEVDMEEKENRQPENLSDIVKFPQLNTRMDTKEFSDLVVESKLKDETKIDTNSHNHIHNGTVLNQVNDNGNKNIKEDLIKEQNFEERYSILQSHGWQPFRQWFLEPEFRNWWQLSGFSGVPVHKIYRTSDGKEKVWKSWETHAPSKNKHLKVDLPLRDNYQFNQKSGYNTFQSRSPERYQPPFPEGYEDNEMDDSEQVSTLPKYGPEVSTNEDMSYNNRNDGRTNFMDNRFDQLINTNTKSEPSKVTPTVKTKPTSFAELTPVDIKAHESAIKTSKSEIGVEWSQNDRLIKIRVNIEGLENRSQDMKAERTTATSLKLEVNGHVEYSLEIELAHPTMEGFCVFAPHPTFVEIKMKKDKEKWSENDGQWESLCANSTPNSTMESS